MKQSHGIAGLPAYQNGGGVTDKLKELWTSIRSKADKPGLGYLGAAMTPGVGPLTDLVEIGAGLQDEDLSRIAFGIAGLAIPVVSGAHLRAAKTGVQAGRQAARNIKKGKIVSIRDMSPEEGLKSALRGAHLKQHKSGQYVGAPRGLDSPQRLSALRRSIDRQIAEGAEAGDWYVRARAGNVLGAGPDPVQQNLLAQELGFFSPQADPSTNLLHALQARTAYEAGAPLSKVRTGRQGLEYIAARTEGRPLKQGPKTGPFYNKIDPTQEMNVIPTNDFRVFQIFGYTDPKTGKLWTQGGTPQMHAFVDSEWALAAHRANDRVLGGRTDWNSASIQAAPWVMNKARALMKRAPKKYPTLDLAFAEANKTYPDFFNKFALQGTYEMAPGRGLGHLEGIENLDPKAFNRYAGRSPWRTKAGRDVIYEQMNLPQLPTTRATGYYPGPEGVLETNPAFVARPMIGREPGLTTMDPRTKRSLSLAEHLRGLMGAQRQMGFHRVIRDAPAGQQTSVAIGLDRKLRKSEVLRLQKLGRPFGLEPIDTGRGVTMMNTEGASDSRAILKALKTGLTEDIQKIIPDAKGIERVGYEGDYFNVLQKRFDRPAGLPHGKGTGTRRLLAKEAKVFKESPNIRAQLESPEIRRVVLELLARDKELARVASDQGIAGLMARPDMQNLQRLFGEGGWEAVREGLRSGVPLPAIAGLGFLGARGATAGTPESGGA